MLRLVVCLFSVVIVATDDIFIQLKPLDFANSPAVRAVRIAGGLLGEESGMLWRQSRRRAIGSILKDHAQKTQAPIIKELEEANLPYKSFWINNSIWVHGASPMFQMLLLAKFKAAGKPLSIVPDRIVAKIPEPIRSKAKGFSKVYRGNIFDYREDVSWNLKVCKIPEAWKMSRGAKITVATIDTGVTFEHSELKSNYRGSSSSHAYSWFDPQKKSAKPNDEVGHGTHTMGTIVGSAVGIAPEAKWISARGCTPKGCTQHDLLASAQWVMCPTDEKGGNQDCDQGADLVSNSWGAEPTDGALEWFQPIVKAWVAAGMIPIFAIGNAGPACGTTGAPGNYANVIAVGSTGPTNMLSPFSSRGPCPLAGSSKPDLVAPGEKIISAGHEDTTSLVPMSGTSMATPHVAGIVALMLSIKPSLDAVEMTRILKETANSKCVIKPMSGVDICKGVPWNQFPHSHHYGAGMVDAEAALKSIV